MPCEWYRTGDGAVIHINRGRSRGAKKRCKFCRREYRDGKLCDFPVGKGKTCDAEMCADCATTLGSQETKVAEGLTRLGDTFDVCPIHRGMAIP